MSHPALDPDFDQSEYGLIDLGHAPSSHRERGLFVYVIIQALTDIGMIQPVSSGRRYPGAKDMNKPHVRAALLWLLHNKEDFFYVCELASVEAHCIRDAVRAFMRKQAIA